MFKVFNDRSIEDDILDNVEAELKKEMLKKLQDVYNYVYINKCDFYLVVEEDFLGIKFDKSDKYFILFLSIYDRTLTLSYRLNLNERDVVRINVRNTGITSLCNMVDIILNFADKNTIQKSDVAVENEERILYNKIVEHYENFKENNKVEYNNLNRIEGKNKFNNLDKKLEFKNLNNNKRYENKTYEKVNTIGNVVKPGKSVKIRNIKTREVEMVNIVDVDYHYERRYGVAMIGSSRHYNDIRVSDTILDIDNNEISSVSDFYKVIEGASVGYKFNYREDYLEIVEIKDYEKKE